ncbi:MAG TPA: peroxiredoxin [Ruminiclostridium sp.]|nr:peroxiredoxin [Ruminiclostridium sp.]
MDKKVKTFILIGLFILSIAAAGLGYNYLTERYKPENRLKPNAEETPSPEATGTEEPLESIPPESTNSQEEGEESEDLSPEAPDFTVFNADGNEVRLSDYEGTPVILNFWASWCSPCKSEMPHFNKVSEEYKRDELIFLMVDLVDGKRETVESGKRYIKESGYTFTVLYDTNQDAAITYGIRSIPSTLFINKDGYVEAGVEGMIDEETLRLGIDMILP